MPKQPNHTREQCTDKLCAYHATDEALLLAITVTDVLVYVGATQNLRFDLQLMVPQVVLALLENNEKISPADMLVRIRAGEFEKE